MTGKQRMEAALQFKETDRAPHFEVMFELEDIAFNKHFPDRDSWTSMSPKEK